MNAIEAHKLGKFDIVLMYGAILTHFDSWNMPRLFASSAKSLKEDGIIVIEEFDRVHRIFTSGFKDFIIENPKPEELSISIHVGYDLIRGSYKRSFIRMRDWKSVMLPINFRSISTIASTLWFFTKDVDIVSTGINGVYVVLGKGARRLLEPEHLAENPTVLQRGNPWDSSIKKG